MSLRFMMLAAGLAVVALSLAPSSGTQYDTAADHGGDPTFTVTAPSPVFVAGDTIWIGAHWYETTFNSSTELECQLPDATEYKSPWNDSGALVVEVRRGASFGVAGTVVGTGTLTVAPFDVLTDFTPADARDFASVQHSAGNVDEWTDTVGSRQLVPGAKPPALYVGDEEETVASFPLGWNDLGYVRYAGAQDLIPDAGYSLPQPFAIVMFASVFFNGPTYSGRLWDGYTINQAIANVNFPGGDLWAMYAGSGFSAGNPDGESDVWMTWVAVYNGNNSYSKNELAARVAQSGIGTATVTAGLQYGGLDTFGTDQHQSTYSVRQQMVLTSWPATDAEWDRVARQLRWQNSQPWYLGVIGDSNSDPSHGGTTHWPELLQAVLGSNYGRIANFALSGATFEDVLSGTGVQAQLARWTDRIAGRQCLLVMTMIGANSNADGDDVPTLTGLADDVVDLIQTTAAGLGVIAEVLFCDWISRAWVSDGGGTAAAKEARRVAMNTLWATTPPGTIKPAIVVPLSADPRIGAPTSHTDPAYFQLDGVHLAQGGQDVVEELVQPYAEERIYSFG